MSVSLKRISNGKKFVFPSNPDGSLDVETSVKYQNFDIINRGQISHPTGFNAREYKWSGRFFGKPRKGTALIQEWKYPKTCIRQLLTWMKKGAVLNLIVTSTGINADVTISDFKYSPVGGYGDFEYTIKLISYKDLKIKGKKNKNGDSSRNAKPKKRVYTVKKNYKSRTGICKISKKYYGTTSKWSTIYKKNKKKIENAAKKHNRKNSDRGKYLYKGTKLVIP